ncbi:MAG: translation initiation factor IF-2 [Armatimonadota bacterium]|nr:translation initiation factor IF-2 [Armatimonadota bacterium]MCX7777983.1 translation initiation factor IF-2 [Armatimonadota bacterium]MDW8026148.1 translation initiation factor IF-2 [Armatimonadota bacterium]
MGKVRIHQLAKELGMSAKELVELLQQLGEDVKGGLSTIDESTAEAVRHLVLEGKGEEAKRVSVEKRQKVLILSEGERLTAGELASRLGIRFNRVVDWALKRKGVLITPPMELEHELVVEVAEAFGFKVELPEEVEVLTETETAASIQEAVAEETEEPVRVTEVIEVTEAAEETIVAGAEVEAEVPEEQRTGVEILTDVEQIITEVAKGAERIRRARESGAVLERMKARPPVVTVMGHVDHGKTTLLDYIRKTNVAAQEVGQITQRIGASVVEHSGRKVVFIDTPGHEAFTALRARGAQVTDIAVLVVAADDGVMPQTIEAINHARAAGVPIIVAINKIDKAGANPDRVRAQLAEVGLVPVDWGGKTECVEISALRGDGVDDLLEVILLQAEIMELKADPEAPAWGVILEAEMDPKRGPAATVIVQQGTLKVGDCVVAGYTCGRIRTMFDDKGREVKSATPSIPVRIYGLEKVPEAGDILEVVEDMRVAREIVEQRRTELEELSRRPTKPLTLEEFFQRIQQGGRKELRLIVKADAQGSLDAVVFALQRLEHPEIGISIIHQGVGNVSESDVMLAIASEAIILGFNVRIDPSARRALQREHVDVRLYQIIYELIDDVKRAILGMLEPIRHEEVLGVAEVRATFKSGKFGVVAGCFVKRGKIVVGLPCRVMRNGEVIYQGKVTSLRRYQEDRQEILEGMECGIGIEGFTEYQIGDTIEVYTVIQEERRISEIHERPVHWDAAVTAREGNESH